VGPLEQHTEGVVVCTTNQGPHMTTALSDEEIAGTHVVDTYHCSSDAYFVPPHPSPGQRWKATCHGMGERVDFSGQVLAMSAVKAGGREIPAIHTRLTLSFAGAEAGTNPTDYWVSTQDALILASVSPCTSKRGPVRSGPSTTARTSLWPSIRPLPFAESPLATTDSPGGRGPNADRRRGPAGDGVPCGCH